MKTTIRSNVFETNSSSIHALIISKEEDQDKPNSIAKVEEGQYGWYFNVLKTPKEKLDYIWTAILGNSEDEEEIKHWEQFIRQTLALPDTVAFERFHTDDDDLYEFGYIDHEIELENLLYEIEYNPTILKRLVYNDNSFIQADNDRDEYEFSDDEFNFAQWRESENRRYNDLCELNENYDVFVKSS